MGIGNKLLTKALLGTVFGIIVGVVFWVLFSSGDESSTDLILHLTVSGLLGLVSMGGSVVYDIESWGVFKVTAIHYLLCMFGFTTASIALGWFPDMASFFVMFAIMTVVYAGIWIGEWLYWKKTIGRLNEQLKVIHEHMNEDMGSEENDNE